MHRLRESYIKKDLETKIVLLAGPRQCGKTTLSKQLGLNSQYLNFDDAQGRKVIFSSQWDRNVDLIVFDELHKMKKWKDWIKGVFDFGWIFIAKAGILWRDVIFCTACTLLLCRR